MHNPGAFRGLAGLAAFSLVGCFGKMYVPAPSATYDIVEGEAPALTGREQELVDQVNARLVAEGFPAAKVGAFETKAALLEAEVRIQKSWSTSPRRVDETFVLDPDEKEDTDVATLHMHHWLLARGVEVPSLTWNATHGDDFAKRKLSDTDLDKMWFYLHPSRKPVGELKIGVAIVPDGWDGKRYFVVLLRDDRIDLDQGPPRKAEPGSTFEIRGQLKTPKKNLQLAVLHPDGKAVDIQAVDVQADGHFAASYQLPKEAGRYDVALGPGWAMVNVPVFAGVEPSPWPAYAPVDATDPDDTRGGAKEFATALETWRKTQGLSPLPIPTELCAFAKEQAKLDAEESVSPMTKPVYSEGFGARALSAGLVPDNLHHFHVRVTLNAPDEPHAHPSWETFVLRAPWDPFAAAVLLSPDLAQLAIGAVPEPQKSTDDPKFIDLVWISVETPSSGAPSAPRASR